MRQWLLVFQLIFLNGWFQSVKSKSVNSLFPLSRTCFRFMVMRPSVAKGLSLKRSRSLTSHISELVGVST